MREEEVVGVTVCSASLGACCRRWARLARLPLATGKVVVVNGVAPKPVGCERILEHAAPTCDDGAGPCSAVGLRLVRTGPHASQQTTETKSILQILQAEGFRPEDGEAING